MREDPAVEKSTIRSSIPAVNRRRENIPPVRSPPPPAPAGYSFRYAASGLPTRFSSSATKPAIFTAPGFWKCALSGTPVRDGMYSGLAAASFPAAARGPLAEFKDALGEPADLRQARRAFEPFSTALADLARSEHVHHREDLHVFQCPMTPVLGTGRWLSRRAELRNPFFGSAMLKCGDEVE